jgi:hypothetical protein
LPARAKADCHALGNDADRKEGNDPDEVVSADQAERLHARYSRERSGCRRRYQTCEQIGLSIHLIT